MTVREIIEEVAEEICDNYCKWPEQYGKTEDEMERLWRTECEQCPLNKLH